MKVTRDLIKEQKRKLEHKKEIYEEEKEYILKKRLDQIEAEKEECRSLQKQFIQMEEEFSDQNKYIKAVNDDLFERYSGNSRLQNILLQKEEGLRQKRLYEDQMLEDCRDDVGQRIRDLEKEKESLEADLQKEDEHN